jgi:biopolymer transport protein ExbD
MVAVTLSPPEVDADGNPLKRAPVLYFNDQIVTLDGLRQQLDQLLVGRGTPALVVKADRNVPLDVLTDVMNVGAAHRLSIYVATKPAGP